jgi:phage terminase Nu1 subunit (DNA packaging protein)
MAPKVELVGLPEIMKLFDVSDVTIDNWRADGMPHQKVNGRLRFKPHECVAWRRAKDREEQRKKDSDAEGVEASLRRKAAADADLAELKRDQMRGELVPVADYRREVERLCSMVRARVLSVRGRWAPRVIGLSGMAEATAVLDELAADVLKSLEEGGDELESEEAA